MLGELRWLEPSDEDAHVARALFDRASDAGDRIAAIYSTNLLASGIAGSRNWMAAIERLRSEAVWSPERRNALALIERMDLDESGNPASLPASEQISQSPFVESYPKLFTAAECAYLVELSSSQFRPSTVLNAAGIEVLDPVRSSHGATFDWLSENPAIHALNRRLAAASETHAEQGEPAQILRYRSGQQYRRHFDFVPAAANQRIKTALVWLNHDFRGGETLFFQTGLKLRGRKGQAFIFCNVDSDGSRDPASEHAGLPVSTGTKYILSRWIRQNRWQP